MCCEKCGKLAGILVLIVGIIYLLVDLGVWAFWGISLWTVLVILAGLALLGHHCCDSCKVSKKKK
ncbi:hypothetical protein ACFL96_10940 [Thermoproteota archaeon]